jgi:hypothetical protein
VWWVNQGDSYADESAGGYLLAPKTTSAGVARGAYNRLQELRPGDVVIHYADQAIVAISRVTAAATEVASTPRRRTKDCWRVTTDYFKLDARAVEIARVVDLFRDLELAEGPFQKNRKLKNGYLWRFSRDGLRMLRAEVGEPWPVWAKDDAAGAPPADFVLSDEVHALTAAIDTRGFRFEPWLIAAFVTALRTKPFVILAGVSGTGKSRLPGLIAAATGAHETVIPVRPDWADSADVIGYLDLQGQFRPGAVLRLVEQAGKLSAQLHLCVLDEMNLARVEHYFAEVLSRLEGRAPTADGGSETAPLVVQALSAADAEWGKLALPANLAFVGTVNMDESDGTFSRKVLDRAFTLELSDVDLHSWGVASATASAAVRAWPIEAWRPAGASLGERATRGPDQSTINEIVSTLVQLNGVLAAAQLQIGFRSRDEIVRFVLNAREIADCFATRDGQRVDPLDLALMMKILPRIAGGSGPIRDVLIGLIKLVGPDGEPRARTDAPVTVASSTRPLDDVRRVEALVASWKKLGRPATVEGAKFPRTTARLYLMWDKLESLAFTSFWT